jgi:hypothetical protein
LGDGTKSGTNGLAEEQVINFAVNILNEEIDIEYQIEDRIESHNEAVQFKRSVLDETCNRQSQVERMIEAGEDCGLGRVASRGRVHARAPVFLALCLRVVVITSFEPGDNPITTIITV